MTEPTNEQLQTELAALRRELAELKEMEETWHRGAMEHTRVKGEVDTLRARLAEVEKERDELERELGEANACIRDRNHAMLLADSKRDLAIKELNDTQNELAALRLINEVSNNEEGSENV